MKLFGVAGNPVLHSKSPVIFKNLFKRHSSDAGYIRVAASSEADIKRTFDLLDLDGMNVTAPFKESVLSISSKISETAGKCNSANVLKMNGADIFADSFDHYGVTGPLRERGILLSGKKVLVLGAGGAGRAAVYGLLKERAIVTVVNRTHERAESIALAFGVGSAKIDDLKEELLKTDILISTLPGKVDIIKEDWLKKDLIVLDANYSGSLLTEIAAKRGCNIIKGESWLAHQAVPSYKLFTGEDVPVSEIEIILRDNDVKRGVEIVSLVGFMGSGKTSIGELLSARLGWTLVDLDSEIEKVENMDIPQIFSVKGVEYFRKIEKSVLAKALNSKKTILSTGGGIVLDPVNRNMLAEKSLNIWLAAGTENTLGRIDVKTRPLLNNDDPLGTATRIFSERRGLYAEVSDMMVLNENRTIKEITDKIYAEINPFI